MEEIIVSMVEKEIFTRAKELIKIMKVLVILQLIMLALFSLGIIALLFIK